MPYKMRKVNGYKVTSPTGTHAKRTTKEKAKAQIRLLHGVKSGKWKPTGKRRLSRRS